MGRREGAAPAASPRTECWETLPRAGTRTVSGAWGISQRGAEGRWAARNAPLSQANPGCPGGRCCSPRVKPSEHGSPRTPGPRSGPTAGHYLLPRLLPPAGQAARRDGRPRGDVFGHGHQLLPLEVHGLPVPGDRLGAAADELQGGQPGCGERSGTGGTRRRALRASGGAPPQRLRIGRAARSATPDATARPCPRPAARRSPAPVRGGGESLTPPPRRGPTTAAAQRRHLCRGSAKACGKVEDRAAPAGGARAPAAPPLPGLPVS